VSPVHADPSSPHFRYLLEADCVAICFDIDHAAPPGQLDIMDFGHARLWLVLTLPSGINETRTDKNIADKPSDAKDGAEAPADK